MKLKNVFSDPELWFLVFFNCVLAYYYYKGNVDPLTLIWIYYTQNLIIGLQYFLRMRFMKNFTATGFKINGQPADASAKTKGWTSVFFAFHYGFFHFVYFIFLIVMSAGNEYAHFDSFFYQTSIAAFAGNMVISLISQVRQDRETPPNIGSVMFTPYLRIFPMHLFIILGMTQSNFAHASTGSWGIFDSFFIFIVLKTLSDCIMHVVVNKTWLQKRKPVLFGDVL